MSFKRLGIALAAALALSALVASSASAAVKTVPAQWYFGGVTYPTFLSLQVWGSVASHPAIEKRFTLKTVISGLEVDLTATGLECVECRLGNRALNESKFLEPTTTENASVVAWGTGKLKFTGVTAMKPENCTVKSSSTGTAGVVETKELVTHGDWMDTNESNLRAFIQFIPKAGPATTLAQFFLSGPGCEPIEGSYNITGSVFGETVNNTGVNAFVQNLVFSPAVQSTAGAQLKVGANNADLTGTGAFELAHAEGKEGLPMLIK